MGRSAELQENLESRIKLAEKQVEKYKAKAIELKSELYKLNKMGEVGQIKIMPSKKCFALGTDVFFKIIQLTKLEIGNIWVDYIEVSLKNKHLMRKSVRWDELKLHSNIYRPIAESDFAQAFSYLMRDIHEGLWSPVKLGK